MTRSIRFLAAACALALAAPAFADAAADSGKSVYAASCASCHGADGKGNGPDGMYFTPSPTDFTTAAFAKQPDAAIHTAIAKGKGNMPGFESKLSSEAIDKVVAYLRTLAPAPAPKAKAKKAKKAATGK